MNKNYDAIIIGAGAAGLICAFQAGKRGRRILIIEKSKNIAEKINGTYHFVSPKYLQTYVNEFAYRYNRRNQANPLFSSVLSKAVMPF